ncbi:D-inositol 3-phosphate glycosyltransferase [Rubripirellula amarantea]|uniref:D-inositol 3-phosphate glycosyltransferase n=1 Tax=Rubripirellula amarantea TaxID=2527999 RepID=A0A5C5WR28_9BACT|nr:glycosyltransferase [Rubripirellula amarantea]TWT52695.1 D-inositol 3-phosphate glycosyltransferase [Rubripirellula amarantea]
MSHKPPTIWYVTMAFPVPSEAFATVEINELRRQGVDVRVKTLRGKRRDYHRVCKQQNACELDLDHASCFSLLRGLTGMMRHPWTTLRLGATLFSSLWRRPAVLTGCVWWSLRCFDLLSKIKRERPEIVHLYWGHVPAILGWLILQIAPNQRVTTSLSAYDIEMAIPLSFEVARRGAGVRTWSPANVATLSDHGVDASSVKVVHQGINLNLYTRLSDEQRRKIPSLIAFAGRLIPQKGVAEALEIITLVSKSNPAVHLQVYGDGPERHALRCLADQLMIKDQVTFHGHVDPSRLAAGLASAGLFLLHSTHSAERLPNVLKEAIAAGCYCLTTPSPDVEQLITDDTVGKILPAGKLDLWAASIEDYLAGGAKASATSTPSQVLDKFDIRQTVRDLLAWWSIPEPSQRHGRLVEPGSHLSEMAKT